MTSAVDSNGDRILNSPAGDRIVEKVLQNGEEYFSSAVSLDGVMNYGYFHAGLSEQLCGDHRHGIRGYE